MPLRRVALLALVALPLAAGCGGDGGGGTRAANPFTAVSEAATRTAEAGSSRMSFEGSVSAAGQEFSFSGEGEFDYEEMRGRLTVVGGVTSGETEVVIDGSVYYYRFPEGAGVDLPEGKKWLKFDLEALTGQELAQLQQLNQTDPTQFLNFLRGVARGGIEEVGPEDVRGTRTVRYSAEIDLRRAAEQASENLPEEQQEAARESLERLIEQTGTETIPVDVWIDDEGLARRIAIDYGFEVPGQDGGGSVEITMDLYDFGLDVEAEPPSEDETADFRDILGGGA